jgi:cellobiose transport system substrate-binding protein
VTVKLSRRTKAIAAVAGAASIAIIASGCAPAGSGSNDGGEKIELSVATFNDFGYTEELLQEYMDANPNVTVVQNVAATSNDARANYFQKLG